MAVDHPAVVVVEDLHWADEAMLAFLEHVATDATRGPLFVLATARPELLAQHPDFAEGLPNAHRVELAPLTTDETASLVASLLGAVVPPDLSRPIIERADGNPLYAEEYVALLRDRDLLVQSNGSITLRTDADLPLPDSIHALLAARLDALPADRKSLLTDAAVFGKVFWDGPLVSMGERDPGDVVTALDDLAQLGFLRLAAQSSMAGEREYAFWHVLGRDVAYRQLPRGSRAARHAAAAAWLEAKLGDRVDDIADVLADHYGTALELSRAAGQDDRAKQLQPKAIDFLVRAGDRAMGLDVGAGLARFEAAMALAPPGHVRRAEILVRFADTARHGDRHDATVAALDEAIALFENQDDWRAKAGALVIKAKYLGERPETGGQFRALVEEAIALLEGHEPTPELVDALTERGVDQFYLLQPLEAVETFDRAMAIAKGLGLPTPGRALGFRGDARLDHGDPGGMDDFRESVALSVAAGQGRDLAINTINMGVWVWFYDGPAAAMVPIREAIDHAARYGFAGLATGMTLLSLQVLIDQGAYEEMLATLDRLNLPAGDPEMRQAYGAQYRLYAVRGLRDRARAGAEEQEDLGRSSVGAEARVVTRITAASVRGVIGDLEAACRLIEEAIAIPEAFATQPLISSLLPDLVRAACDAARVELAERILRDAEPRFPYAAHAQVAAKARTAEARGRFEDALAGYRDAAARWEVFTIPLEEGHALLGEARCLIASVAERRLTLPSRGPAGSSSGSAPLRRWRRWLRSRALPHPQAQRPGCRTSHTHRSSAAGRLLQDPLMTRARGSFPSSPWQWLPPRVAPPHRNRHPPRRVHRPLFRPHPVAHGRADRDSIGQPFGRGHRGLPVRRHPPHRSERPGRP